MTPLGEKEGVGHAAANDENVHARDEIGQDLDLGRDLGAADNGHDRPFRVFQRFAERGDLGHHQQAGIRREKIGDGLDRGMRPVGRGEGVVDIDIAMLGEASWRNRGSFFSSPG